MKVELTPDATQWVAAEIDAGAFPTAEDAVRHAIGLAKLAALRNMLDAAEAEGGSHTSEEARKFVQDYLDDLEHAPKGS